MTDYQEKLGRVTEIRKNSFIVAFEDREITARLRGSFYGETADKLPEEARTGADDRTRVEKAPARKQAGVKTAARVAAAGKKTVTQTRKKATGAADGK